MNDILATMKKYPKSAWHHEHVAARPFVLSAVARGFVDSEKIRGYSVLLCHFREGELDWMPLIEDQDRVGRTMLGKYLEDENYWRGERDDWMRFSDRIESVYRKLQGKPIENIPNSELVSDIRAYTELQLESRKVSWLPEVFGFFAERAFSKQLHSFMNTNFPSADHDRNHVTEILTRPEEPSFFYKVESDLIEIADLVEDENRSDDMISSGADRAPFRGTDIGLRIEEHLKRFDWIRAESFFGARPYTYADAIGHISEILSLGIERSRKKNESWKRNLPEKIAVMEKYRLDRELVAMARLSSFCAKWQDVRKENTLKVTTLHSKYLSEIFRRSGTKEDLVGYLDYSEAGAFLAGDISEDALRARSEGVLFVYEKEKLTVYTGNEARGIVADILKRETGNLRELSGVIASSGYARGTVRVVVTAKDAEKVGHGDILISSMTRPEHILAMKRAGAIVTDEGGITSHAAIVSRELGKPCVIGTKNATRAFGDGDQVEVDARRGVIRKISE